MPAETEKKERGKCQLLKGMYYFQIESVKYMENVEQLEGEPRDEVRVRAFLLKDDGSLTQNPDFDDEPFVVTIFGVKSVYKLVAKTPKGEVKTNAFKLLNALGLEPKPETQFTSINWDNLVGLYGWGFVEHSPNGLYPRLAIPNIKPLDKEEYIKHNLAQRSEVFSG